MESSPSAPPAPAFRLCVAQLAAVAGDKAGNLQRMRETVAAWAGKADLVVFPELCVSGYGFPREQVPALAEPLEGGPTLQAMQQLCREHAVAVLYSFPECVEVVDPVTGVAAPAYHITVVWLDAQGALLARYRKVHLWDPFRTFERICFREGAEAAPVVLFHGVRVGLLICWDVEFPEPPRALALAGAQVLLAMGANADAKVMRVVCPARALENLCHVVYCNMGGERFCGLSCVFSPLGEALLQFPDNAQAVGCATIQPDQQVFSDRAAANPFFVHRRPDLYAPLALPAV